jgi:hypothetical protein
MKVDLRARLMGHYKGRRVYCVPVRVVLNNSTLMRTVAETVYTVLSHTPADAANHIRQLFETRPETEIYAYGPLGGETYRYIGWESSIGAQMFSNRRAPYQLPLMLERAEDVAA